MPNATLADLFGVNLLLHYAADGASKLFTDTGGTAPAADGNAIKCWKPEAAAVYQVNLTEGTNGPAYRADYAGTGYKALEFDGTNDVLSNSAPGFGTGEGGFFLSVYTPIGASNTIWSRGNSGSHYIRHLGATTAGSIQSSVGGPVASGTLPNARRCVACAFQSAQSQIDVLGFSGGNQTNWVSASLSAWFQVGAFNTGSPTFSQHGNFALHEVAVISTGSEWGQVLRAAKVLRNKWGITDPNTMPQAAAAGGLMTARGFTGGIPG